MTPFFFHHIEGEIAYLEEEEARHCVRVMRFGPGDRIAGVDGRGTFLEAVIEGLGKDLVKARILRREANWGEHGKEIILGISPLHKPDRLEWLAEKAVELGVTRIQPFIGARTVKTGFRMDRFERILIAGVKQCLRSRLPSLSEPISFGEILKVEAELRILGWCEAQEELGDHLQPGSAIGSALVLIGPEGDFSAEEVKRAESSGFRIAKFGESRLRTETAGIYALSALKFCLGY